MDTILKKRYSKLYYLKHRKELLVSANKASKIRYKKYKQQIDAQHRQYWKKNRHKFLVQHRINAHVYYLKNKQKIIRQHRIYENKKRKTNLQFRVAGNLRRRLNKVLRGFNKSQSTLKFLGCSFSYFKHYLIRKFTTGMSWSNYGKWHIDHIKPCCQFDLSKESEQKKCFHYKNLQPLWKIDNSRKGGRYA